MLSRRHLLATAAAVTAVAPQLAFAEGSPQQQLSAFLDAWMASRIRRSPELATSMGIDKGDLAWTRSALVDKSVAARVQDGRRTAEQLAALRAIGRTALTGMDGVNYDTFEEVLAVDGEGSRRFSYFGEGVGLPYAVSQLGGAYYDTPNFLDARHTIETRADADAYLARLDAFAGQLEDELELVRHDAAQGVTPPDFVIGKTLLALGAFLSGPPEEATVVTSVARRAKEKGIEGDYGGQAARLYEERVAPALARQVELLESLRPGAVHDAGVWRLPNGDEYYALSLRRYTTTALQPDEIHRMGLELVGSMSAEADKLMRKAGYTRGTVGQRFRQMYDDPRQHYPNTDAGKEQLIADLNGRVKEIEAHLPEYFGQLPKAPLEVRRVPKAIEVGAPGGYYYAPTLDGSRPGIYWINLRDTAAQPKFVLTTLTVHEGVPGHHLQLSLANEAGGLPLARKSLWFSGYGEGWALYAEQLAVEMGLYGHDPIGRIGMLHDAIFRAVRLVVDTGMHANRWSREEALKYYVDHIGDEENAAIREIERYAVQPGQACSYMVGKQEWLRLRAKAKAELGPRFDIRAFHDAGLLSGAVPLTVLERVIDGYIASARG